MAVHPLPDPDDVWEGLPLCFKAIAVAVVIPFLPLFIFNEIRDWLETR